MGVSRHLPTRLAAAALSLGVAWSLVAGAVPAQAATPTTTTDPAQAAAGWIAAQVEAGGLSAGSLADSIFAFAAARVGGTAAADALTQLRANADAYIGYGGTVKPGPLGKVLLAVVVAGGDPTSFNGHNLEADLRGLLVATGADAGQFGSASINDQALDILALAATPGGVPAGAGSWLASKQCASGEYQWDGSCPTAPGSEDPDTTSFALQALAAAGSTTAADKATQWLLALQAKDGSFASSGTPNTDSTGIAAEALRAQGQTAAADAAATWLATQQYGCSAKAADRGAFPWAASYAGELIYSTPQAVLGFGAPRLDKLSVAGAAADAPVLACAAPTPTAPASATLPTAPPTDAVLPASTGSGSSSGTLLLVVVLAAASGALAFARRPGQRR